MLFLNDNLISDFLQLSPRPARKGNPTASVSPSASMADEDKGEKKGVDPAAAEARNNWFMERVCSFVAIRGPQRVHARRRITRTAHTYRALHLILLALP